MSCTEAEPCKLCGDLTNCRECESNKAAWLVGEVGICSIGRPGLITGRKEMPWGWAWVGIGLDGKGPWSSRKPKLLGQKAISELMGYDASMEEKGA